MNYSFTDTVDNTGKRIIEFDAADIDSLIISTNADIYFGFGDLSQAVFPLLSGATLTLTNRDFRPATVFNRNMPRTTKIFAKKQTSGSATIYIGYLGGNV